MALIHGLYLKLDCGRKVCKLMERTIATTVQNTLNQLGKDSKRIADLIDKEVPLKSQPTKIQGHLKLTLFTMKHRMVL